MKRIERYSPQFGAGLICSSVLALMIVLFLAAQGTDPARYNASTEVLRQMRALDKSVNEDAFELRFGLLSSCDALNAKMAALSQLRARLKAGLKSLETRSSVKMQLDLAEVDRTLADKQAQVEQFKTSNAVQSNSRYYFPAICDYVRSHDAGNPAYLDLPSDLEALEHDVLLHNISGDPALSAAALARIMRMQRKEVRLG